MSVIFSLSASPSPLLSLSTHPHHPLTSLHDLNARHPRPRRPRPTLRSPQTTHRRDRGGEGFPSSRGGCCKARQSRYRRGHSHRETTTQETQDRPSSPSRPERVRSVPCVQTRFRTSIPITIVPGKSTTLRRESFFRIVGAISSGARVEPVHSVVRSTNSQVGVELPHIPWTRSARLHPSELSQ